MPVEYGRGQKQYPQGDCGTVTQYTKWFVMNDYEYVIHYSQGKFGIHAHNLTTKITTKCPPAETLETAYHNAYCHLKNLGYTSK